MIRISRNVQRISHAVVALALIIRGTGGQTVAAQSSPSGSAIAPSKPLREGTKPSAGGAFKNIEVLKESPADQLIPAMQFITASLGVECDFCHVPGAFEKDDKKPKQTARKMMRMMFTINKENFDGNREVTCYSCHRGSAKPLTIPVIAAEPGAETGPVKEEIHEAQIPSRLPAADEVVDKYILTLGGAAAIANISTRVEQGTADFAGHRVPVDVFAQAPDLRATVMHLPKGDSVTASNGEQGWLASPGRPVREMSASELAAARLDADLHFATDIKGIFTERRVERVEEIGGRKAYVIAGSREGRPPVELYFDGQSGLLIRMVRYSDSPLGLNPTQIDYADYREQDGVKLPFRWTVARPGGSFTIEVQRAQQNVAIDAARFAKPASAASEKPEH